MGVLARQGSNAAGIVAQPCSSTTVAETVLNVDRFLRGAFVYRLEKDEVLRTVEYMLNDYQTLGHMEGDCDDMCIMACSMFVNLGILCRMTAIKSQPTEFDHVFAEASVNANWVPVDPTVQYGTVYTVYGMTFQAV